ncbi:hypothetical protein [Halorussus sp. MSC15.2]|uniref:hypothetical protein n=1 Tax=Halorussus sp. MSC15.2 TaxID=2283638 RepID=UPI0013D898FC|nr:hypothetical protein [Halorussus sp. MSC15.2]NEU56589.1 hypothetical protein [Halorussus sp. MSC15.2]
MSHDEGTYGPDEERAETLREIGEEIRGESSESKLVAAMLYRVSDLYDPDEETSPRDIYVNMREIIRTKES